MKKRNKKIFGVILIILGIIGLVLPGLQGILMIFAGFALLGFNFMKKRKK